MCIEERYGTKPERINKDVIEKFKKKIYDVEEAILHNVTDFNFEVWWDFQ